MIELSPINPVVPKEVVAMVTGLEEKLRAGTFHPSAGRSSTRTARERLGAGEVMADDVLGKMDYFVEGVSSRLPKR